jgi:large-conductance mechanosensitive channel
MADKEVMKEKKQSFFEKIKTKIDKMIESDTLTFAGKCYMLNLYFLIISFFGVIIVSFVNSIINALFAFYTLSMETVNEAAAKTVDGLLSGATGAVWLTFIITFITFVCMTVIEMINQADNEESILEKEKD